MDAIIPNIDLQSLGGIVAATIVIVQALKGLLASVPALSRVPVSLYVVVISAGLTWFAAAVLHTIDGDLRQLVTQAVLMALASSGAVEWWRAGAKPLADSERARDARLDRELGL